MIRTGVFLLYIRGTYKKMYMYMYY